MAVRAREVRRGVDRDVIVESLQTGQLCRPLRGDGIQVRHLPRRTAVVLRIQGHTIGEKFGGLS